MAGIMGYWERLEVVMLEVVHAESCSKCFCFCSWTMKCIYIALAAELRIHLHSHLLWSLSGLVWLGLA